MEMTRRNACSLLSSMLVPRLLSGQAPYGQGQVMPSALFPFDKLPVHASSGAEIRAVLKGKLATGESLEVHETTLPPGGAPHPPHHHLHSEMWLIREGTVELTVNGAVSHLGPGSVGFVRSGDEHGLRNRRLTLRQVPPTSCFACRLVVVLSSSS